MTISREEHTIREIWNQLYDNTYSDLLDTFLSQLKTFKTRNKFETDAPEWYKDVVVYSLYVDLFSNNFPTLTSRLDYFEQLGINCLWLLPVLESPMKDGGFDVRRYDRVRRELLGLDEEASDEKVQAVFREFLQEAHQRGIKIIFDVAMNHTSEEHEWFQQAKSSPDNPFRDYYIWSDTNKKYGKARLLFKGMVHSNWEEYGDAYYFHRFYSFQPDLNYRNPKVLTAMCDNFLYWLQQGVDGFRLDAIPFLWKEEGTGCENLPQTHAIIRFVRAVLDFVHPAVLLLAEACQPPFEVVKYFGNGDECHAAYHFPLMPQIFKALAQQHNQPIQKTLSPEHTPQIPENAQWFTFLRNHDELTLEMVSNEDRNILNSFYLRDPRWGFRIDEGISARLADLMEKNPQLIGLAFSLIFTLPGTPIIYYGDEFGKLNDEEFYEQMSQITGYGDSRFFGRGKIKWDDTHHELKFADSFTAKVYSHVNRQILMRNKFKAFGRGNIDFVPLYGPDDKEADATLAFFRRYENESLFVVHNLARQWRYVMLPFDNAAENWEEDLFLQRLFFDYKGYLALPPRIYYWFKV